MMVQGIDSLFVMGVFRDSCQRRFTSQCYALGCVSCSASTTTFRNQFHAWTGKLVLCKRKLAKSCDDWSASECQRARDRQSHRNRNSKKHRVDAQRPLADLSLLVGLCACLPRSTPALLHSPAKTHAWTTFSVLFISEWAWACVYPNNTHIYTHIRTTDLRDWDLFWGIWR